LCIDEKETVIGFMMFQPAPNPNQRKNLSASKEIQPCGGHPAEPVKTWRIGAIKAAGVLEVADLAAVGCA
jgi:hypothetical protein